MGVVFRTKSLHGYAVEFSPYFAHRLVCAAAQYFGIAGSGAVLFLEITADGQLIPLRCFPWKEGLYDVTWSEFNERVAVTGSADGSLQVWDVGANSQTPVTSMKGHTKEVAAVDWSQDRRTSLVLSASWDMTVKLWDITRKSSLMTFRGHNNIVYSAIWSPHIPGCFASTSVDTTLRIWDIRKPDSSTHVIHGHTTEILTCDWSKYDKNLVVTGASDCVVRGFDLRSPAMPVFELRGHEYPIRRLKCSPFNGNILATCSYDFSVRIWDTSLKSSAVETLQHHTEFVCGLDFNLHIPGQMVDCSWDETVKVYAPASNYANR